MQLPLDLSAMIVSQTGIPGQVAGAPAGEGTSEQWDVLGAQFADLLSQALQPQNAGQVAASIPLQPLPVTDVPGPVSSPAAETRPVTETPSEQPATRQTGPQASMPHEAASSWKAELPAQLMAVIQPKASRPALQAPATSATEAGQSGATAAAQPDSSQPSSLPDKQPGRNHPGSALTQGQPHPAMPRPAVEQAPAPLAETASQAEPEPRHPGLALGHAVAPGQQPKTRQDESGISTAEQAPAPTPVASLLPPGLLLQATHEVVLQHRAVPQQPDAQGAHAHPVVSHQPATAASTPASQEHVPPGLTQAGAPAQPVLPQASAAESTEPQQFQAALTASATVAAQANGHPKQATHPLPPPQVTELPVEGDNQPSAGSVAIPQAVPRALEAVGQQTQAAPPPLQSLLNLQDQLRELNGTLEQTVEKPAGPKPSIEPAGEALLSQNGTAPSQATGLPAAPAMNTAPPPAAPAGQPPVGLPPQFVSQAADPMDQVVEGTAYSVKNGHKELVLRLNPDNLGEVRISLVSRGNNELSARMIASTPESHLLLQSQAHTLKSALEAQGIQVDRLQVVLAGSPEALQHGSRGEFSQGNNQQHQQAFQQSQQSGTQHQHSDSQQPPPGWGAFNGHAGAHHQGKPGYAQHPAAQSYPGASGAPESAEAHRAERRENHQGRISVLA